jgi:hypothetical protein
MCSPCPLVVAMSEYGSASSMAVKKFTLIANFHQSMIWRNDMISKYDMTKYENIVFGTIQQSAIEGYVYIVSDHFASDAKTIPDTASVYIWKVVIVSISATNRWCGGSLFEVVRGVSDRFLQRSHCNVNTNRSNFGSMRDSRWNLANNNLLF